MTTPAAETLQPIDADVPPYDPDYDYDDDFKRIGWTTVATFFNVEDAHFACMQLDAIDIPVYLSGELITGTAWHQAIALGGAKVQVPRAFAERAQAVLQPPAQVASGEFVDREGACPRCGSKETRSAAWAPRRLLCLVLLAACLMGPLGLVGFFAAIAGVSLLSMTRYRNCKECGFDWRDAPKRGFDIIQPPQTQASERSEDSDSSKVGPND